MKDLLGQWNLQSEAATITTVVSGVCRVELDQDVYILKHRPNRTRVWEEYDLLNWLAKLEQPISQLLYTQEGVPWAEHEGSIYVLYPYLEGTSGDALDTFDEARGKSIGEGLARLHQALAAYDGSEAFPVFDLFGEVASYAWPAVQGYSAEKFRHRLQSVEQAISRELVNPYEVLPRQLIHRDFHPGNLIFRSTELAGILDFDRVRIGIRLFDLCYLATSVLSLNFSDPAKREGWFGFVKALIGGYISVTPLTKTEGHAFLYIIYLIQFLFTAYQLDSGNTDLADFNIAMLLWINDQHDYFEALIIKLLVGQ